MSVEHCPGYSSTHLSQKYRNAVLPLCSGYYRQKLAVFFAFRKGLYQILDFPGQAKPQALCAAFHNTAPLPL